MAENTKIEWADHTFNPWVGCQRVSAACDFCYAETLMDKRLGKVEWGPHGERKRTSEANWRLPLKWNRQAAREGSPTRVFCASLADVFDNKVPREWRADLWRLIDQTPHLIWMLLTKRPQNIELMRPLAGWPDNVWLGITAEDQPNYDRRWPILAAEWYVRRGMCLFVSYEPALGPLSFLRATRETKDTPDWLICGGESGPGARPMRLEWARAIRDECRQLDIAYFFKQWGDWLPGENRWHEGHRQPIAHHQDGHVGPFTPQPLTTKNYVRWYGDETRYGGTENDERYINAAGITGWACKVGKKAAGRLLDGREHNGMPA